MFKTVLNMCVKKANSSRYLSSLLLVDIIFVYIVYTVTEWHWFYYWLKHMQNWESAAATCALA